MTVYRVKEFTSPTPENVATACAALKDMIATAGAKMVDIVRIEAGKRPVIARYSPDADITVATPIHQEAFGALVAQVPVDLESIASFQQIRRAPPDCQKACAYPTEIWS